LRSSIAGAAVDASGNPLPWYTRPAIEYLSRLDVSGRRVLEFGGGHSTVWWATRGAQVVCVETSREWTDRCGSLLEKYGVSERVEFVVATTGLEDGIAPLDRSFDVIVVDDGTGDGPKGRIRNFGIALGRVAPEGMVLVDNADAWHGRECLTAELRDRHLVVDFVGIAPGAFRPHNTAAVFPNRRPPMPSAAE
jgi:predicted O-methyltransferase YrrM